MTERQVFDEALDGWRTPLEWRDAVMSTVHDNAEALEDDVDVESVEVAEWIHFVHEWREALAAAQVDRPFVRGEPSVAQRAPRRT